MEKKFRRIESSGHVNRGQCLCLRRPQFPIRWRLRSWDGVQTWQGAINSGGNDGARITCILNGPMSSVWNQNFQAFPKWQDIYWNPLIFVFLVKKYIYPIHAFFKFTIKKLRQRNSEVHYRNVQINTLFIRTDRKIEFK